MYRSVSVLLCVGMPDSSKLSRATVRPCGNLRGRSYQGGSGAGRVPSCPAAPMMESLLMPAVNSSLEAVSGAGWRVVAGIVIK